MKLDELGSKGRLRARRSTAFRARLLFLRVFDVHQNCWRFVSDALHSEFRSELQRGSDSRALHPRQSLPVSAAAVKGSDIQQQHAERSVVNLIRSLKSREKRNTQHSQPRSLHTHRADEG